jgi:hypothetical protein
MAKLLQDAPSATSTMNDPGPDSDPGDGQEQCSPYEEEMLKKVMSAVMSTMNNPKFIQDTEHWFIKATDIGTTIGNMAFQILASIYASAKKAGVMIPPTVFLAQGGSVYQTIDMFLAMAEHMHLPNLDPGHIRETAMGIVLDNIRQHFPEAMGNGQDQDAPTQVPPSQQMAAANPLSHAVSQGLMQQQAQPQAGAQ